MKKAFIVVTIFTCFGIFLSLTQHLQSKSNGSITGYTGAPKATSGSEATCVSCHGGTANTGPHTASISISGNPAGFTPGQVYTITTKIVNPTGAGCGFSMVCLNPAKASTGTFATSSGTRILTSAGRSYINHSGSTLKTWTFTWTAPSTNEPDSVTFYMAGLEAIGATDHVYTTKLVFKKSPLTETMGFQKVDCIHPFPNPSDGNICFSGDGPVHYEIRSVLGVLVKEGNATKGETIGLQDLQAGTYFWHATNGEQQQSGQLILQH